MEIIANALIMPHVGNMDDFTEGVFDSAGNFIKDSTPARGKQPAYCKPDKHLMGTYIYGGCFYGHFGHFIWESLARLATIKKCNEFPVIFLSPNREIHESQRMFLRMPGVKNELILVKQPVSVEKLIYSPPLSSVSPLFMEDEQMKSLACLDVKACGNKKIWLSRSRLTRGKVLNEPRLEKILAKLGYEIIFPEELPLRKQVEIVCGSKIVAGFDGSQFFSLLLSKKIFGEFFVFNRRSGIANTIPYVLEKRGVRHNLHTFDVRLEEGEPGHAGSNYTALEIDRIVEALP